MESKFSPMLTLLDGLVLVGVADGCVVTGDTDGFVKDGLADGCVVAGAKDGCVNDGPTDGCVVTGLRDGCETEGELVVGIVEGKVTTYNAYQNEIYQEHNYIIFNLKFLISFILLKKLDIHSKRLNVHINLNNSSLQTGT